MAERIVSELPPHQIYIEAFAGGAAVGRLKRPAGLIDIFIDKDLQTALRLASRLARYSDAGSRHVICGDVMNVLRAPSPLLASGDDTLVYCDPPYLGSTRRDPTRRYYRCEQLTEAQHSSFLTWAAALSCKVMISGYRSALYDEQLSTWRRVEFSAGTRGGRALEVLWCNFPESDERHDTRFVGAGFRERERIKRKVARHVSRLQRLPLAERAAILAAFDEAGLPRRK